MEPATTILDESQSAISSEKHVRSVYASLSNKDSFEILRLAASGIRASTAILYERDFTRKRYYGRLAELQKLGLVKKESGRYVMTSLGRSVYDATMLLVKLFSGVSE